MKHLVKCDLCSNFVERSKNYGKVACFVCKQLRKKRYDMKMAEMKTKKNKSLCRKKRLKSYEGIDTYVDVDVKLK